MIFLTFKPKEDALGFYPGLADYLSQFKVPQVALLGATLEDTVYENLIVEHTTKGSHAIISVPKFDGVLRYDHLKELYKSDKQYDTHLCTELPYGYEVNYETFLVMEGLGRAAMVTEQPEWGNGGVVPTFYFRTLLRERMEYINYAVLEGEEFRSESPTEELKCYKSRIIPKLEGVEMGKLYSGFHMYSNQSWWQKSRAIVIDAYIDDEHGKCLRLRSTPTNVIGRFRFDDDEYCQLLLVNP